MDSSPPVRPSIPDYALHRVIGRGSYGDVWLARDAMGAWRAVKIVFRERFGSARPFERELAGLEKFTPVSRTHESQVDILHLGHGDGWFYYVMELADDVRTGQEIDPAQYAPRTLASELEEKGRLPAAECLAVGITLSTALGHLHEHGLVHRDIKPSNVIFIHGRPKLADLGLVAGTGEAMSFVGTEGFVPPEGPGTRQADLYSLGRVLYQLHTGNPQSRFPELPIHLAAGEDAALGRELNLIILKACAPESTRRHDGATELREELLLLQSGRSIQRLRDAERRARFFAKAGIAAGVVALIALVAWFATLKSQRATETARRELAGEKARTEDALWNSLLQQARAGRLSGVVGRRKAGLEAIAQAARIRSSPELVNEAIAHLALFDLEDTGEWHPFGAKPRWCVLSADGSLLAAVAKTGLSVQRSRDASVVREWPPAKRGDRLAFSPDARRLAVYNMSYDLEIMDIATGALLARQTGERFLGFAPDGGRYATWTKEHIRIRETATGEAACELSSPGNGYATAVPFIAFDPGGDAVAIVWDRARESLVEVRRIADGEKLAEFPHAAANVICVALHGDLLAFGGSDGTVRVHHLAVGRSRIFTAHSRLVSRLSFMPDGRTLVSQGHDGYMRFWDALRGWMVLETSRITSAGFDAASGRLSAFTYAGSGSWRAILPASYRRLPCLRPEKGVNWTPSFSPDGRRLLVCNHDGFLVMDGATGALLAAQTVPGQGVSGHFLADGSVFTMNRTQLSFWPCDDLAGAVPGVRIGEPRHFTPPGARYLETAALSADRSHAIFALEQNAFALLDLADTARLVRFGPTAIPKSGAISRDFRTVITGTFHGRGPLVWDVATAKVIRALDQDNSHVFLSPDGATLLVGGTAAYRFYDTQTWTKRHEIPTDSGTGGPNDAAWSPDGRLIAIRAERRNVDLLDAKTWRPLARLTSPDSSDDCKLTFSPDGTRLAVGTDNDHVQLWDLTSLERELAALGLPSPLPAR